MRSFFILSFVGIHCMYDSKTLNILEIYQFLDCVFFFVLSVILVCFFTCLLRCSGLMYLIAVWSHHLIQKNVYVCVGIFFVFMLTLNLLEELIYWLFISISLHSSCCSALSLTCFVFHTYSKFIERKFKIYYQSVGQKYSKNLEYASI